ncbi:MAG: ComEC/Rec2 family competence protein [Lutispora sp.]|nr:ComEC/Rec2 family competence protein [Lutispora sp.]MEA4960435.1 ComEC/Rec2 family competence protein [Lutispora sp.]
MKKKLPFFLAALIIYLAVAIMNGGLVENSNVAADGMKVHFIDVGQADSILIQSDEATMLIDGGNNADAEAVVDYIKSQNIKKLDYVIGTHPHEDHIGGLDAVIESFDIGAVYMPKAMSTTKTFEDVLKAISNKGLKVNTPIPGTNINLGSAVFTILAPNSERYESTNNYSIVIKLTNGKNSFLFTGDAESISEKEMLAKGFDLYAEVLKVGHHGSTTSTTKEFLDMVNPRYAIISVGKDNQYGHPHKEILDRLRKKNIIVYRTDESGTIIASSDGESITFSENTKPVR